MGARPREARRVAATTRRWFKSDDDDDDEADAAAISSYAVAGLGGLLILIAIAATIYMATRKQRKTSGRWADVSSLGAELEAGDAAPPAPIVVLESQSPLSNLIVAAQKKALADAPLPAPGITSPMQESALAKSSPREADL